MRIELINPLTYTEKNKVYATKTVGVCFHQEENVQDSLTNLIQIKNQVLYIPSPHVFWNTDFLTYEENLKNVLRGSRNVYYLNNKTKTFKDKNTGEKTRFIGGVFWNDYGNLNEELVTIALMKSKNFSRIKAHTWFANPENSHKFNEINDKLLKHNTYHKTFTQYYKPGYFHPIISYFLYLENVNYLTRKMAEEFEGTTIVLSYNQPTNHAIYFDNIQVNHNAYKLQQALGKKSNIETYVNRKTSLENALQKMPIQYLLHANSDKPFFYRYYHTNIFCLDHHNHTLNLHKNNTHTAMKNTLQYIIEENQKFVEVIKKVLLNNLSIVDTTKDLTDLVEAYNYSVELVRHELWQELFQNHHVEIKDLNVEHLQLSAQEIRSNNLNKDNNSQRINSVLAIIAHNHFSLQDLYNKMYNSKMLHCCLLYYFI